MSSSTELPMLEPYCYEHEILNQPLLQPDTSYWLTAESPVARALSSSTDAPARIPSLHNGLGICTSPIEPRRSLEPSFNIPIVETAQHDLHIHHPMSHLQLSEVESYADVSSGLPWVQPNDDQMMFSGLYPVNSFDSAPTYSNSDYLQSSYLNDPSSPYSTPSLYNDSPVQSPYLSASELYSARRHGRLPRSSPPEDYDMDDEDDEDVSDGKPYARLIYEALLQAPGHRMMLREVYEWFERNTNKPRESGSNGWQNSIRHNLSMNKAFENDKTHTTNSRGETKKATSVWFLTQEALMHGVQSTTRYRKTGGVRKAGLGGSPDYRRQRSGAKGGRAARRAARLRRLEQSSPYWAPINHHDDAGPFNNLVHAANYLRDYSPHYDNSNPPTPSESYPYISTSPVQRFNYGLQPRVEVNVDVVGEGSKSFGGSEVMFQQRFDGGEEEMW